MNDFSNDLKYILQVAINSSKAAGDFVLKNMQRATKIDFKGRVNMVTGVDKGSQEIIVSKILKEFPGAGILAEESGESNVESDFKWIIDPLDGTTNFVHGFPCFAVSIAVEINGRIKVAVVHDPYHQETFYAIEGGGAYLNGSRIRVSQVNRLINSLLATGFPYELNEYFYKNMEIFKALYQKCQGIRRAGAATIDMCYVACGRFDGYWEFYLNPWDVATGYLIVKEAGGKLSNASGREFSIYGHEYVATNGLIHDEILSVIKNFV